MNTINEARRCVFEFRVLHGLFFTFQIHTWTSACICNISAREELYPTNHQFRPCI